MEATSPSAPATSGNRIPLNSEGREQTGGQNNGADVFGRGRFEQVRAAARAVAHVVAHQIGNDGGVARIVLRNPSFHFADQVGAHVRCLGVDAAAELREKGDEAGAESEGDDLSGYARRIR